MDTVTAPASASWPAALSPSVLKDSEKTDEATTTAAGEVTIRWLPGDVLVVGQLLIVAGHRIVETDGDIAQ